MSKSLNVLLPLAGVIAVGASVYYATSTRSTFEAESAVAQKAVAEVREVAAQQETVIAGLKEEIAAAKDTAASLEQALAAAQTSKAAPSTMPVPKDQNTFGLGRPALAEEIAAWDIDVLPDGRGLPPGRGDVLTGEEVFADQCAVCHGDFAEGVDNWPVLAGGFDTLADKDPVKTVGSYWPYLSTVWDYVNRSMPFGGAQTLSNDEVYAIVAYILYSNDLVEEDFELSHENFLSVEMPNATGFIVDNRAAEEYPNWSQEPCMQDCKASVEITMRASVLDVTPKTEEDAEQAAMPAASEVNRAPQDAAATTAEPQTDQAAEVTATETEQTAEVTEAAAEQPAQLDPAAIAAGEKVFKKCVACHQVGAGAKNKVGPQLNNLFGRPFAAVDGYKYSAALTEAAASGRSWTAEEFDGFMAKPRAYLKGTKMAFAGLKKEADRAALAAYLMSLSE